MLTDVRSDHSAGACTWATDGVNQSDASTVGMRAHAMAAATGVCLCVCASVCM